MEDAPNAAPDRIIPSTGPSGSILGETRAPPFPFPFATGSEFPNQLKIPDGFLATAFPRRTGGDIENGGLGEVGVMGLNQSELVLRAPSVEGDIELLELVEERDVVEAAELRVAGVPSRCESDNGREDKGRCSWEGLRDMAGVA